MDIFIHLHTQLNNTKK